MRDPAGYLIEVGQCTEIALDCSTTVVNLAREKQQDV
jgi:hypothetical protein